MADIEYTFAFSLPVQAHGLYLGELEDLEAVAMIVIDESGESWYVEEYQIRDLTHIEKRTTDTLFLNPHDWDWITTAVKDEFKKACHSVEIDRMVRAERADDDSPTWEEQERAIYHQSVL